MAFTFLAIDNLFMQWYLHKWDGCLPSTRLPFNSCLLSDSYKLPPQFKLERSSRIRCIALSGSNILSQKGIVMPKKQENSAPTAQKEKTTASKGWWSWFRDLKRFNKLSVIGAIASVGALIYCFLPTGSGSLPSNGQAGMPPGQSPLVHVNVNGNGNETQTNVAPGGKIVILPPVVPEPDRFIEKIFLRTAPDGGAPRVLTTRPEEMASGFLSNKGDLNAVVGILLGGGFFCEPGTEIELIGSDKVERNSQVLSSFDSLHSKIKIVSGPHSNKEGWILPNLWERKQIRESERKQK
jgi:hypothetical protein